MRVSLSVCVANYASVHSSSIGRQLRIKHLKLGAYCEKCKLYISTVRHCQPLNSNQSCCCLSLSSLSLSLTLYLHCLLLFLFVMHFARKLKIISILLCENNSAANDVHLYGFSSHAYVDYTPVCVCVRACVYGHVASHVNEAYVESQFLKLSCNSLALCIDCARLHLQLSQKNLIQLEKFNIKSAFN